MSSLRHRFTPGRYKQTEERRPPPSHRHSNPSAPWPWINIYDEVDAEQLASGQPPIPPICDHSTCGGCWRGYPQSRFPNWTLAQVQRSGIRAAIDLYQRNVPAKIHHVDVDHNGFFKDADKLIVREEDQDSFWDQIVKDIRPSNNRVRALFVEDMSGPVLQMLGAKYNIEPFFFSSSLSWIPSRFQEEIRPGLGDHITITLTFIRIIESTLDSDRSMSDLSSTLTAEHNFIEHGIDTQAPLELRSPERCYLALDLLAIHLIRSTSGNTIISFHSPDATTNAPYLHERIRFAGQSVYWQSIFQKSPDPTFVLLTYLWHAMYAWDEALERLYSHICWLETQVLITSDLQLTRELHTIRAHHLHFSSLLEDFRKSVLFILDTPNPAMDSLTEAERLFSRKLLEKECKNLMSEVDRLEASRMMQDKRLKNVMNLVFSSVNIEDSRRMAELTAAAVRDSAGICKYARMTVQPPLKPLQMKQIAYLSMVFLPASFVAAVFGMNVQEIVPETHGTLPHYVAAAVPLTLATVWIVMAFQSKYLFAKKDVTIWKRLAWPMLLFDHMRSSSKERAGVTEKTREHELQMDDWDQA